MRYAEIEQDYRIPDTHPYVAAVKIDPADHRQISRMIADRPELRLLHTDSRQADKWTIHVGCASKRVQSDFEDWISSAF